MFTNMVKKSFKETIIKTSKLNMFGFEQFYIDSLLDFKNETSRN